MVKEGYSEQEVMDMTLDKLEVYTASVSRRLNLRRRIMVIDTAASVVGVFGSKGNLEAYLKDIKG